MNVKPTSNGISILHKRYVKDDLAKKAALEKERVNARVAEMIKDMRERAGLSQAELAEAIGTKQSAISRLEDADYEGHSLRILQKIADALDRKLVIQLSTENTNETGRIPFGQFLQLLRRRKKLTVDGLSQKIGIDRHELAIMEQSNNAPEPIILKHLSEFYKVPLQQMLKVAGVIRDLDDRFIEHTSRFAAKSESFDKLTSEEKKALDEFVTFLRTET